MSYFLNELWILTLDAAPWLVLGLFIGGLFKSLIPTAFLQKHLSQGSLSSVVKAAFLGAPLPLCSCGVIPAALGLRRAGASKPATTSFLVATPETGVDSIGISYAMMGPFMAVIRPIAAISSAIITGLMVHFFDHAQPQITPKDKPTNETKPSCCASQKQAIKSEPFWQKAWDGIHYAFSDLYIGIVKWLVIGLLFAALVQAYVPHDFLIRWGDGWLAMLVMLLAGIPMYVCATASTPIAAGFLMAGVSPGAVLVYMLAGPATNMATLGVIHQEMGKRTMILYLSGIMGSALLMGWLVNLLAGDLNIQHQLHLSHEMIPPLLQFLSFALLFTIALMPLIKKINQPKKSCCD